MFFLLNVMPLTQERHAAAVGLSGNVWKIFSGKRPKADASRAYSHSMVEGGLELMSYTTRFTPRTLLMISVLTLARNS